MVRRELSDFVLCFCKIFFCGEIIHLNAHRERFSQYTEAGLVCARHNYVSKGIHQSIFKLFAIQACIELHFLECSFSSGCHNSSILLKRLYQFTEVDSAFRIGAVAKVDGVCVLLLNGKERSVRITDNVSNSRVFKWDWLFIGLVLPVHVIQRSFRVIHLSLT